MNSQTSHFDSRSATYDRDAIHHRVVASLLSGARLNRGDAVLDIATGTGILALEAARRVGPTGQVVAVDLSPGMLAEAHRKAAAAGLQNIDFSIADAERLELTGKVFDSIFCSSALVMMSDIPATLRHWRNFLKPGGTVAFDMPAKPFGLSELIAGCAATHGIHLPYATLADTHAKCRALLENAGFEVMAIETETANTAPMELPRAIAFWNTRADHPAWRALMQAAPAMREAVHADYIARLKAASVSGFVPNTTALNLAFGRNPA